MKEMSQWTQGVSLKWIGGYVIIVAVCAFISAALTTFGQTIFYFSPLLFPVLAACASIYKLKDKTLGKIFKLTIVLWVASYGTSGILEIIAWFVILPLLRPAWS